MPQTQQRSPIPQRAGNMAAYTVQLGDEEDERPITPTRRKRTTTPHKVSAASTRKPRTHCLTPFAIGVLIVLFVYIGLTAYIIPWFTNIYNQWHYGDARIVQLDATINGRHDHFIAEVLHGKVLVIDIRDPDTGHSIR